MIERKTWLTSFPSMALVFAALSLLVGCTPEKKSEPTVVVAAPKSDDKSAKADPKADPKADVPAGQWGDITGRVVWGGTRVPAAETINVGANVDGPVCTKNGPLMSEEFVISANNKGMKNVFVWLEPVKGAKLAIHPDLQKVPEAGVVMDQPSCLFIPQALALRQGQSLIAKNSSKIVHNFSYMGNPKLNLGGNVLLPPDSEKEIKGLVEEKLAINIACNIHPWMKGYVRVFDHPYFAVTDADGAFTIKNAPTGNHKLKYWHSSGWLGGVAGRDGYDIAVKPGATPLEDKPFPDPK